MTRRGKGLGLAAIALLVLGRTFGAPELQMAGVAAVLLVVGAAVMAWTGTGRPTVERTIAPSSVWFGEPARVTLTVRNAGRLPTPAMEVTDAVPAGFGQPPRAHVRSLAPGARASVGYELLGAQRGSATIGPVTLATSDPFGLVRRARRSTTTGSLTVYPPVWRLPPGLPLGGSTATGRSGRPKAAVGGDELADIREYVTGDDLRAVHWPSTAHRGRLMIRRSESARAPTASLLLDVRAARHAGRGPSSSFETAVAAAASVAYHLSLRGRAVVLLDRPVGRSARTTTWQQLLRQLADARPTQVDLGGLSRQVAGGAAGDGSLVAVVTTPDAGELRELVRAFRGFATRVALVVDVRDHAGAGPDPATAAAVQALRAAGIRAVTLGAGDRIDDRWRELLARPRTEVAQ